MGARYYWVYIMTNARNSVFYTGMTGNIRNRVIQHKSREIDGFTRQYNVGKLVYVECFDNIADAIRREKRLKRWKKAWKLEAIRKVNPELNDLAEGSDVPLDQLGWVNPMYDS